VPTKIVPKLKHTCSDANTLLVMCHSNDFYLSGPIVRPLRALERRWGSGLGSRARDGGAVFGWVEGAGAGPHLPIPVNCNCKLFWNKSIFAKKIHEINVESTLYVLSRSVSHLESVYISRNGLGNINYHNQKFIWRTSLVISFLLYFGWILAIVPAPRTQV
jgi:hypothetical protein